MKKCKTLDLNPFSVATGQNSVVLSKFNADEDGVKYVPWKSAKPGNWALTDDDFVALCVKRQSYTDKRNRQRDLITLSFAKAWSTTKAFKYTEFLHSGGWGNSSPGVWIEKEARRTRTKVAVVLYVEMLLSKGEINWTVLGRAYRPDQRIPQATVKRLFRHDKVKDMIRTEIRKALSNKGINEEEVLEMYLGAYRKAEEVGKPSEMRAVAGDLAELLGMNKPDSQSHYTETYDSNWDYAAELEEACEQGLIS
jgi:hypothetical protein